MAEANIRANPLKKQRGECAVSGCSDIVKHNDLCGLHYGRWHRKGSALWEPPLPRSERECSIEGCTQAVESKQGYCKTHFSRWRRKGDALWLPQPRPKKPAPVCCVDGCEGRASAKGLCKPHRIKQRAHGDPNIDRRLSPKKVDAKCQACGDAFLTARGAAYCGDTCARRAKNGWTKTAACSECGVEFTRKSRSTSPCCSDECRTERLRRLIRAKNEERKKTVEYHEKRRLAQQRRRARQRSLPTEDFSFDEIASRDGWRCGLCNDPVDRALRYPDPKSPSLDHVIPLAKGGGHTRGNAQLAHLRCNIAKGARTAA